MSVETKVTRTCDYCGIQIKPNGIYVAASVYGADFHKFCFESKMDALALAKLCGLDDIEYAKDEGELHPEIIGRAWRAEQRPKLTDHEKTLLESGGLL